MDLEALTPIRSVSKSVWTTSRPHDTSCVLGRSRQGWIGTGRYGALRGATGRKHCFSTIVGIRFNHPSPYTNSTGKIASLIMGIAGLQLITRSTRGEAAKETYTDLLSERAEVFRR